jgi:formylglycine-generating enzyme required for sulfatase activity
MREGLTPAYTVNKSGKDSKNKNREDDLKWIVTWNKKANGYRLPTEAEWEYACRAGTKTAYSTGSSIGNGGWYSDNSNSKTQAVGRKPPNAWGLYDMHGNVYEWCWDWKEDYTSGSQTDPSGAASGSYRILRGGSWYRGAQSLRSADRIDGYPGNRGSGNGFRVCRSL